MNLRLALGAVLALSIAPLAACGSSNNNPADARVITNPPDAMVDAATPPADANCIENPTTSNELMNACTDAVKVAKSPTLPLVLTDGGLPPLP
ncbi:MAG TPA: hypothetical protein VL463_02885 [Kofleriaceae bacterium]|jgi:hypothetical protein|nr:hypothetical protein [Kofleriaceae bacterium]